MNSSNNNNNPIHIHQRSKKKTFITQNMKRFSHQPKLVSNFNSVQSGTNSVAKSGRVHKGSMDSSVKPFNQINKQHLHLSLFQRQDTNRKRKNSQIPQQQQQKAKLSREEMIEGLYEFKRNVQEGKIFYRQRPGSRDSNTEQVDFNDGDNRIRRKSCTCQRCGKLTKFQKQIGGKFPLSFIYQIFCNEEEKKQIEEGRRKIREQARKKTQRVIRVIELSNSMIKDQKHREEEIQKKKEEEQKELQSKRRKSKRLSQFLDTASLNPTPRRLSRRSILLSADKRNSKDLTNGNTNDYMVQLTQSISGQKPDENTFKKSRSKQFGSFLQISQPEPNEEAPLDLHSPVAAISLSYSNLASSQPQTTNNLKLNPPMNESNQSNSKICVTPMPKAVLQSQQTFSYSDDDDYIDDEQQTKNNTGSKSKQQNLPHTKKLHHKIVMNQQDQQSNKQFQTAQEFYYNLNNRQKHLSPTSYWKLYQSKQEVTDQSYQIIKNISQERKFAFRALQDQGYSTKTGKVTVPKSTKNQFQIKKSHNPSSGKKNKRNTQHIPKLDVSEYQKPVLRTSGSMTAFETLKTEGGSRPQKQKQQSMHSLKQSFASTRPKTTKEKNKLSLTSTTNYFPSVNSVNIRTEGSENNNNLIQKNFPKSGKHKNQLKQKMLIQQITSQNKLSTTLTRYQPHPHVQKKFI